MPAEKSSVRSLEGKVSLITGAGSGIGRATAKLFSANGSRVVVADIDSAGGQETVAQIKKAGGEAVFVKVDVTSEEQVHAMIEHAVKSYGGLDVLHNNAAIMRVADSLEKVSLRQWQQTMEINVTGVFLGCKHGMPALRNRGGGVIINTITGLPTREGGWNPAWGTTPDYIASKGAVHALTTHVAALGKAHGIRVNCLAPCAGVNTPMQRDTTPQMHAELRRWGLLEPEDVAAGALYLAARAQFTGGVLTVVPGGPNRPVKYEMAFEFIREPIPDVSQAG